MANPEGRQGAASTVVCVVDGVAAALGPDQLRPSGAFIATDSPQPIDAEITVTLCSAFGEAVLRALVVQVITREQAAQSGRGAGYGVLFLDLADDQRAFIGLTLDALDRAQREAALAAKNRRSRAPSRPRQRIPSTPLEPPHQAVRKRKLTAEGADVLRRLRSELEKLPTRTPFAVLGLEPDADAEAARNAFLQISKRCHPHVYARFDSPEISAAATELFIAYKRAYTSTRGAARPAARKLVSNAPDIEPLPLATASEPAPAFRSGIPVDPAPALRSAASIAPASSPSSQPARKPECVSGAPRPVASDAPVRPSSPPPAARALAQRLGHQGPAQPSIPAAAQRSAVVPLRASQPARLSMPARSAAVRSDRPHTVARRTFDAEIALSSALKHLASSRFDQAELELEQLCTIRPAHRDSQVWLHVCRARRYKAERNPELAMEEYRAVLELDPDHREAQEHTGVRRKRGGGGGGKWFGGDDE